ncbi:MAG: CoA transferase [Sphingomonadales bacterium]|nr:CoA transferase [Sphingomonadales bacterium]
MPSSVRVERSRDTPRGFVPTSLDTNGGNDSGAVGITTAAQHDGRQSGIIVHAPRPILRDRKGPLAGVRVLELTKVWAGPYAGKLLAHLGAEVIKVESRSNLDEMRAYGGVDIDSAPYFQSINQEIQSVQLNTKTAEGLALFRDMVRASDIVIDNIRPGAMERSQLDWAHLRAIRPDLIQVAIKMWGTDGPLGYQTGYAPCFAALSGLNYLVGHEGEVPRGMNIRYGDSTAGALAALASVAALHHREATGEGQFVDLSTVEALSTLVGDSLFAHALTGQVPQADGNYHAEMCPHGIYPCAGGEWLSIAVASEGEWQALRAALALPDDPAHCSLAGRQADRHALDRALAAACAAQDAVALGERLRQLGVPAFRCASSLDLCGDYWLWSRGHFRMVSDHKSGSRPIIGPSWRFTPGDTEIERGAPLLGEHNDYVYREVLGLSAERLADLVARKVVD